MRTGILINIIFRYRKSLVILNEDNWGNNYFVFETNDCTYTGKPLHVNFEVPSKEKALTAADLYWLDEDEDPLLKYVLQVEAPPVDQSDDEDSNAAVFIKE